MKVQSILAAVCFVLLHAGAESQVRIQGGNVLIQILVPPVPVDPLTQVNSQAGLRWARERGAITKITASTLCPGQRFGLRVRAMNVSDGIAAPEVDLVDGMPSTDFVTGISTGPPGQKTCTLWYTATASYAQGNSVELGNDVHTVTYTLVAQ